MNKKAFTLIELVGVTVILGIILTIAVPSFSYFTEKSRRNTIKSYKQTLIGAAKQYFTECINNNICADGRTIEVKKIEEEYYVYFSENYSITSKDLIDQKYMDKMKDPKANDSCSGSISIKRVEIKEDTDILDYTYEYTVENFNCPSGCAEDNC